MKQRTFQLPPDGTHVAIIMDGNGRWATARGLPRPAGHRAGVESVRRVVAAAPLLGVRTLTLFAFSSYNWQRPVEEVANLVQLLDTYLRSEVYACVENGIRVTALGRRDRLPPEMPAAIAAAEAATRHGRLLHLRMALDYSSREAILRAARQLNGEDVSPEELTRRLAPDGAPDVDLLIRTGGDQRLSDFLLWECAFAELYFTRTLWPDFSATDLEDALKEFRGRARAGHLSPAAAV